MLFSFAPFHHAAPSQPVTLIPWLQEGVAGEDDVIDPSPEPQLPVSPDISAAAGAPGEDVATDLAASVIGVDLLPAPVKGTSPEVWDGSSRESLAEAMRQIRLTPVRSANLLLRELLSTPADASATPLASERADALLRMGALPEALAAAHAATEPNAAILDNITRAALLYGHNAAPCSHTRIDVSLVPLPGAAGVFCEAVHGSPDIAFVRLELERELGDITPLEAGLLDAVIQPELAEFAPRPNADENLGDLAAGLVGFLGMPFPEGFVANAPVRQLWRFLDENREPSGDRLRAMARLEATGLLDTVSFRTAILRGEPDPGDEIGVWTALLLQMADTRDPALFGRLVEASLKLGRRQGREALAARLVALPARRRAPGFASAILPSVMRRVFLLADDPDTALLWLDLPPAPEAAMLFSIALPEFAGEWRAGDEEELSAQFAVEGDLRAGHILAALQAFGVSQVATPFEPVPVAGLPDLPEGTGAGERTLRALAILGEAPAAPGALLSVLRELEAAGFGDRARRIAIEVILLGS